MTVPVHAEFAANGSFGHLKLGATLRRDPKTVALADYLDEAALPPIPPTFDLTSHVHRWPMYGNDTLGDCTCAAAGHMVQAWTAANGKVQTPLTANVEKAYWATGDGTDDGRVETDVLNYWRTPGIGTHKISYYAYVNSRNLAHVRAAAYLFGGVYTGIALPLTAQQQHVWDVVGDGQTGNSEPGSWGGHAVPYVAYDSLGFTIVTWGGLLKLTTRFHAAYTDEVYAIISPDWLKAGKTIDGFNLAQLQADLAAVR